MNVKTNYEADKRKDYDAILSAHNEITEGINNDLIDFQDAAYELGYKRASERYKAVLEEIVATLHEDNAELDPLRAIEHADSVARYALEENGGEVDD